MNETIKTKHSDNKQAIEALPHIAWSTLYNNLLPKISAKQYVTRLGIMT